MPYTEEQFLADYKRDIFNTMTPEEKMTGLKPQERLAGLKPQERLAGLKPSELKELETYLHHLKQ